MRNVDNFRKSLEQLQIELTDRQIKQFLHYYEILIEWNSFMNLTGITEYDEVVNKHFIDSLSLVKVLDVSKSIKILDMGTGAGFPGIPLKIAFPNLKIVLLDSLNKRIKFLNEVISRLNLENITAIHGRAEDFGKNPLYREQFDLVVSRAVANLTTLSEYCIPYVKRDGYFISYKSGTIQEELEQSKRAIGILGARLTKVETFTLPETEIERSLVIIQKKKETPNIYPRSAGKPSKEPIV